MKKLHAATVFLGVLLLLLLIWQIGFHELWQEMALLGWGLVPLILIEGVADVFHTLGWRHCLPRSLRSLSFSRLFRIRLAGYSVNYLTPTATLGGEVAKGSLLSLRHSTSQAFTGVLIGKLAYTLAQLLFVALGTIVTLWGVNLPIGLWPAMLASSALLLAGVLGFLAVQKCGKLGAILRWLSGRKRGARFLSVASQQVSAVDDELRLFYEKQPMGLPSAIFWHVAGLACGILQTWYFLFLLTDQASLRVAAGIWFLGSWFDLLTFAIPLGIGIQEATRVFALKAVGFDAVMGLTYGLTLRLEQIFWAGAGLLSYGTLLSEKPRRLSSGFRSLLP
jgi:uncharacterized protein (TIRG00374 family)